MSRRPELCVGAVVSRPLRQGPAKTAETASVAERAFLLVKRANPPQQGRWSLPGGRVEWGETLREAVVREVLEETGVHITVGDEIETIERMSEQHHFVIVDFFAEPVELELSEPLFGTDAADAQWFSTTGIVELAAGGQLADELLDFLRHHRIVAP